MKKIGVLIGRFQSPQLTEGHKHIIDSAAKNSDELLILVGNNSKKFTMRYPLPIDYRKELVKNYCNNQGYKFKVDSLMDYRDNEVWSKKLDKKVAKYYVLDEKNQITLYGSRDSFIDCYTTKKFPFVEINEVPGISATSVRNEVAKNVVHTEDWAAGVIYTIHNQYPVSYQVVDIAILKTSEEHDKIQVLLGRKHNETQIRFPGGFVDVEDDSLEQAARREAIEECGNIELTDFKYITSKRINDWRYQKERNKIMTSFYACHYVYGQIKGSDDLAEVSWWDIDTVEIKNLVPEHQILFRALLDFISKDTFINRKKSI